MIVEVNKWYRTASGKVAFVQRGHSGTSRGYSMFTGLVGDMGDWCEWNQRGTAQYPYTENLVAEVESPERNAYLTEYTIKVTLRTHARAAWEADNLAQQALDISTQRPTARLMDVDYQDRRTDREPHRERQWSIAPEGESDPVFHPFTIRAEEGQLPSGIAAAMDDALNQLRVTLSPPAAIEIEVDGPDGPYDEWDFDTPD